jgi:circadian clock protein KaiB
MASGDWPINSIQNSSQNYVLTLYISGVSPRSSAALVAIREICDRELNGRVELNVVDIRLHPERLTEDRILAIPTLVRRLPLPLRQIVGNLSNIERVLIALDILPQPINY